MHLSKRRILIAIVFSFLGVGAYLYGPLLYESYSEYMHRLPFDSTAWQDTKQVDGDDPIRIRMIDDLIKSGRLDHASRVDVENMLGKPTATNYFKDNYDMVYWLGPERGFIGIDSEWLAITLDSKGAVKSYKIVHN